LSLAPKPRLTGYDQTSLQLKGSNFPPNINFDLDYEYKIKTDTSFGDAPILAGTDSRQGTVAGIYNANSTGAIDIKVDLYTGTLPFQLLVRDESTGSVKSVPLKGPVKGSEVTLTAKYRTPIGLIPSDALVFTWTKAQCRLNHMLS
jgi:hypothetical protein